MNRACAYNHQYNHHTRMYPYTSSYIVGEAERASHGAALPHLESRVRHRLYVGIRVAERFERRLQGRRGALGKASDVCGAVIFGRVYVARLVLAQASVAVGLRLSGAPGARARRRGALVVICHGQVKLLATLQLDVPETRVCGRRKAFLHLFPGDALATNVNLGRGRGMVG